MTDVERDSNPQLLAGVTVPSETGVSYISRQPWSNVRPHVLVVACSDGRIQVNVDDFLEGHLNIVNYDRMYLPGGPGALVSGGFEFMRADQIRKECTFLIQAHEIEQFILLFHGSAPGGPDDAVCADYRRKFGNHSSAEINAQQQADFADLLRYSTPWHNQLKVHAYRAEVMDNGNVRFVDLSKVALPVVYTSVQ